MSKNTSDKTSEEIFTPMLTEKDQLLLIEQALDQNTYTKGP